MLLPAKQVPDDARIGDQISCFVYKDSEDRQLLPFIFQRSH
ncbi:MAG: S1-like domain-containing RNA-binding protein [Anaerostipes hadrus]